ncbi:MAG: type II secretion system F family protein [Phycisphaerae bacterium]
MANFRYIARDTSGQRKEGTKQAGSASDVLGWLRELGLTPVSVTEIAAAQKQVVQGGKSKRIKSADLSALCWQLTTMLEGGIPITSAIETISDDVDNLRLRQILQHILQKMQKGQTLSEGMAEFPDVFNKLTCAITLAGETGGSLPESLKRLAEYFDSRDKLKKKIQAAMAYPSFVIGFIIIIVILIMTFIIPKFKKVFDQLGGELPGFTRGFMAFYDFLCGNAIFIIGGAILIVSAFMLISKTKGGHSALCKLSLQIPLLGKILSHGFVVTFCRTMSTMIASGVSVLEVFDILSAMTNNVVIKSAIVGTREHIVQGANLSTSLNSSGFFPNLVVKMMQVGEESGSLSRVLDRTADYYERKVDTTVQALLSLMEPIMIVTVGGIVLVIVIALYLPIFTMKAG